MGGFARHPVRGAGGLLLMTLLAVGCGSATPSHSQPASQPANVSGSVASIVAGVQAGAALQLRDSSVPATSSDVAQESTAMKAALAELGVKDASVSASGTRISVTVPAGTSSGSLRNLFTTHVLAFRQVDCLQVPRTSCTDLPASNASAHPLALAAVRAGKSCSAAGKSADSGKACAVATYAVLRCADPADRAIGAQDRGDEYSVGCDASDNTGYLLFPGPPVPGSPPDNVLSGAEIADLDTQEQVTSSSGPGPPSASLWEVDLSFTPKGSTAFEALTEKTAQLYDPTAMVPGNLIAIVLDGVVQSAPSNTQSLPGPISITGNYDEAAAQSVAAAVRLSSVPVTFTDVQLPTH